MSLFRQSSASHGRTAELASVLALTGVNTDYRQSQKLALYLVPKLHEAEEYLEAGLDQLSAIEQHVFLSSQSRKHNSSLPPPPHHGPPPTPDIHA